MTMDMVNYSTLRGLASDTRWLFIAVLFFFDVSSPHAGLAFASPVLTVAPRPVSLFDNSVPEFSKGIIARCILSSHD